MVIFIFSVVYKGTKLTWDVTCSKTAYRYSNSKYNFMVDLIILESCHFIYAAFYANIFSFSRVTAVCVVLGIFSM